MTKKKKIKKITCLNHGFYEKKKIQPLRCRSNAVITQGRRNIDFSFEKLTENDEVATARAITRARASFWRAWTGALSRGLLLWLMMKNNNTQERAYKSAVAGLSCMTRPISILSDKIIMAWVQAFYNCEQSC